MTYASFEDARQQAEAGDAVAQSFVGAAYLTGTGVDPDPSEALRWFTLAAEQGHAVAQNDLALLFGEGVVIPRNDEQALFWFQAAAEQGLVVAFLNLARCYTEGRGTPVDLEQRVMWLGRAAEAGDVDGLNELGVSLLRGYGVDVDPLAAVVMFQRAAEQGLAHAQYNLAECLELGEGIPVDNAEAVRWYARAAEQSFPPAMNNLGLCLETGRGADKAPETAYMLFRAAAAESFPPAEYNVGRCFEHGIGVAQNLTEASLWYYKAARVGHDAAMVAVSRLARIANGDGPVWTKPEPDVTSAPPSGPAGVLAMEQALLDEASDVRLSAWDALVEALGLATRIQSPAGVRELTTEVEVMRVLLGSEIAALVELGASGMREVSRRLAAGATARQLGIAWRPNAAGKVFDELRAAFDDPEKALPLGAIAKLTGVARQLAETMIVMRLEYWDVRVPAALVALDAAWTVPALEEVARSSATPLELRGALAEATRVLATT